MARLALLASLALLAGCTCRAPSSPTTLHPLDAGLPASGQWRSGFSLVDLDGDGRVELLHGAPRKGPRHPRAWRSAGDGTLAPLPLELPALAWDYGDAVALGPDALVFGVHLAGALAVRRLDGGWVDDSAGLPGTEFSSRALALGDWTGDGRPEVLALSDGPRPGSPGFKGLGVRVFERGDGGWQVTTVRDDDLRFGDDLAVADLDGDGRADLATASHAIGEARLVDFGGPGREVVALPLPPRALVRSVAAADVDGDGRAELFLVATVPGAQRFSSELWRFDFEDGAWKARALHAQPVEQWAVAVGDVTGDGQADVVTGDDEGGLRVLPSAAGAPTLLDPPAWRRGCRVTHLELGALDARPGLEVVASFAFEDAPERCPSHGGLEVSHWR